MSTDVDRRKAIMPSQRCKHTASVKFLHRDAMSFSRNRRLAMEASPVSDERHFSKLVDRSYLVQKSAAIPRHSRR